MKNVIVNTINRKNNFVSLIIIRFTVKKNKYNVKLKHYQIF